MKKIVSLTLILVVMMTLVSNVYAASSYKVSLEPSKTEVSKGEQFTVDVKISEIQDEKGIIALGATLEYDETSLELVEMQGVGKWSNPTYNELNGEFATDRNGTTIGNETVFRLTFKVTNSSKSNFEISLKNIVASNGDIDIKAEDIKTEMSVSGGNSSSDDGNIIPVENNTNDPFISVDDPTEKDGIGNNKVGNNNAIENTNQVMPDTGSSSSVLAVLIAAAGLLSIVSFVRMKKNEERM